VSAGFSLLTYSSPKAGTAQSVQRLVTGWTAEGSEFESRWGNIFLPQTGFGAHPSCNAMGTGGSLPRGKAAGI
jgi:hypothetical protein